ncbi:methionyl-tRNA formyltransferase [Georgenia subflava]|uniref:Methionyl-tRNA formyltransferase n=1 Tax=Georgenia subflava TaxID=1622177 RepID=A0A6N7EM37_9MICO|nr:methionyl-tRNA formyltransferase [Georgenia subflava]MPV38188.1 methionyl-tRNA formyltransferase [Georgenia subflava]
MRLLFAGTPEVALPTLQALLASQHEVVAVLTRPDARRGRGRTLHPSPVAELARTEGIEVLTPRSLREDGVAEQLAALEIDVAPIVAYGGLVPAHLLELPTHGWVNLHFSLLPAWRGAAPVQRAVIAGDEITGASVFQLEAGLDTGPVYGTLTEAVRPRDTSGDLLGRLSESGAGLMIAVLDAIAEGSARPQPQATEGVSLAPKLEVVDAAVRWADPALAIDRLVRGCTPAPGAWTTLPDGARLKLRPVTVRSEVTDLAPGQVRASKHEVLVGTGSHAVVLGEVAPAGKSWMPAEAWARGARLDDTTVLGTQS